MKTLIKFPAMMLGLLLGIAGTTESAKAQYDDVSLQTFYDELSPYGTWINDPEYGYVWRPDVDQDEFRPYYSNGRWAMTEYGNTWVSNYDWGWAPFHYGRWIYNRYNRWVWIPDTIWGPAWVDWRSGGGYYGWAPMGPSISININIGRRYIVPDFCWNFIPERNIYYNSYPRYYSGRNRVYIQNTVIINNTYVRNNRTYYSGPRADDIRRATGQNVSVYNVSRVTNRTSGNRIENNTVNIYSPRPSRGSDNAKAAPRQVVQGSVTRDRIERNGTVTRNTRGSENGSYNTNNSGRTERSSDRGFGNYESRERSSTTAPSREGRTTTPTTQNRGERMGTVERTERPQRSESIPSRSSSEGRNQTYMPPQRTMERTEQRSQPQPQRTERVERSERGQSPVSSSRSGESSGRASRGESGGRPGRG